jgi:lactate dehydrogenase-like 2-hydroxyacid dehydrogenase
MSKPALLSTGPMMPLITEQLEAAFDVHWMHMAGDLEAMLREASPRIEAVCTGSHTGVKTSEELIARLPKLRIIGNFGVGYDTVDIPAAAKRGIIITNTPDVLTEEVADTTLGLLLMTVRELSKAESYMRAGRWPQQGDYPLTPGSLRDRSIGMMGLGRIGKAITRRLEAFGLPISYYARRKQPDVAYPHYSDLVALARDVDTLIAILPGGPETQNIVNAEVLKALGPRGIFINMARGSVVDESALIAALKENTILSAGLDVFWNEPNVNPELLTIPNLTLLPHVGSASVYTRNRMGQLVVDNLLAYRDRSAPKTPVAETPFKGW